MKHVGQFYLRVFFMPVAGSAELDTFLDTDVEKEADGRRLIRTVIVPHFEDIEQEGQDLMEESLRYYLTKGFDYESFWDSLQVSFSLPKDPRQFFLWTWEELFPGESPQAGDLSEYVEESDMIAQDKLKYKQ
jgi:hypothetical protein